MGRCGEVCLGCWERCEKRARVREGEEKCG